jgi:tripartite-type tricarboxylate transporter receptor subunit TctC
MSSIARLVLWSRRLMLGATAAVLVSQTCSQAAADPAFYTGKTITVVVGFAPGTGYDFYARLLSRHLGDHLPGRPSLVTQNMPGAGGFTAAGYLYNSAPRDGTVLGFIDQASPLSQTLGVSGFRADVAKFNWIGRLTSNAAILFIKAASDVTDVKQIRDREVILSAPGQNSRIVSAVMKSVLGLKLRILTGYSSSAESMLALERGEIDAMTLPWVVLRTQKPKWLADHTVNLLLQMGSESHPDLKQVPLLPSLAGNAEEAAILKLISNDSRVGRSVMAPPGLPTERVGELRNAFTAMLADPAFKDDAAKSELDLISMDGAKLQEMIADSVHVDPAAVARVKKIIQSMQ